MPSPPRPPSLTRLARRARPQAGFTLAEVAVAALLLAIGATGILSVVLQCRYTMKNTTARESVTYAAKRVLEDLKAFVHTPDNSTTTTAPLSCASGNTALRCWTYQYDSSTCNSWALNTSCTHNVTNALPADVRAAPWNATLDYNVSLVNGDIYGPRRIDMNMRWNDSE